MRAVEAVIRSLTTAAKTLRLYPPSSPIPTQAMQAATDALAGVLAAQPTLPLVVAREGFSFRGAPVNTAGATDLANLLTSHGVAQVDFLPGCSTTELTAFMDVVLRDPCRGARRRRRRSRARDGGSGETSSSPRWCSPPSPPRWRPPRTSTPFCGSSPGTSRSSRHGWRPRPRAIRARSRTAWPSLHAPWDPAASNRSGGARQSVRWRRTSPAVIRSWDSHSATATERPC